MVAVNPMTTLTVIVIWYLCNVGVLLLNKFLLSNTGFRQPVFLTLCHMLACCSLGYGLSLTGSFPVRPLRSREQAVKIGTLSAIFCLTIMLGNVSLRFIAVSFSQAIGAATPLFTAILALLLQGHRERPNTYLTLVPVCVGVVVSSGGEPQLHLLGFAAAISATALRALKTVVQAMLLTDPSEKLDPMSLLFYMSSFSVLLLLPSTALFEPGALAATRAVASEAGSGFWWWLLFNSCLAYAVNLTNFLVTKYTSALTLQVLGNMKGVVAAAVSIALFRNPVTLRGLAGYAVTVAGVFMYSEAKRQNKLRAAAAEAAAKAPEPPAPHFEAHGKAPDAGGAIVIVGGSSGGEGGEVYRGSRALCGGGLALGPGRG